jgi:hypothetical protein
MEGMRTRNLVWNARNMCRVVVSVAWLVMAVGEDGQSALRMGRGQLWLGSGSIENVLASVELEPQWLLLHLHAAETLCARVALTARRFNCSMIRHPLNADNIGYSLTLRVALVFAFVLVLFITTVAFGVVGLGLAGTTTVLALLDRTTLGVDMMQLAISMSAAAHTVAFDARGTRPFFAVYHGHG